MKKRYLKILLSGFVSEFLLPCYKHSTRVVFIMEMLTNVITRTNPKVLILCSAGFIHSSRIFGSVSAQFFNICFQIGQITVNDDQPECLPVDGK
jgi:hypothetical protein